jgi:hypothetical protein
MLAMLAVGGWARLVRGVPECPFGLRANPPIGVPDELLRLAWRRTPDPFRELEAYYREPFTPWEHLPLERDVQKQHARRKGPS